jgi:hypothetical protein
MGAEAKFEAVECQEGSSTLTPLLHASLIVCHQKHLATEVARIPHPDP